jgi:hypothetical protein
MVELEAVLRDACPINSSYFPRLALNTVRTTLEELQESPSAGVDIRGLSVSLGICIYIRFGPKKAPP